MSAFAEEISEKAVADIYLSSRADSLPVDSFDGVQDDYLEGYIQSLVDMHYYEQHVVVIVKDHVVYLHNLPHNDLLSNSITSFVKGVPGIKGVEVKKDLTPEEREKHANYVDQPRIDGIWFPQSTVLFLPLIADPREPMYSVNWRFGDKFAGRQAAAVAIGDEFPVYRWHNVFRWQGDLQIGIQAGIWAIFNFRNVNHRHNHEFAELRNTDYLLGIPLTYAVDRWSFRARIYHISSHLGDEFLVNHPNFLNKRKNPSFEALEFITSYQLNRDVRFYAGPGIILHSDDTFTMKTFYVEYGTEIRVFGRRLTFHKLYGTPFIAIDVQNWQARDWGFDVSAKVGYELSKLQGVGRKMRFYAGYHNGYSPDGQFFKKHTQYGELGLSWGW